MSQVSRPVQILLLVVVAFAGAWFTVLKPKPAGDAASTPASQPSAPGSAGLKRAVDKAHGAVAQSNRASGAPHVAPRSPARPAAPASPATPATRAPAAPVSPRHAPAAPAPAPRASGPDARIEAAIAARKVVAVAFYNPASSDDMAVKKALLGADRHGGKVLLMAAPIGDVAKYESVTTRAGVFGSPTVVVIDPAGQLGVVTGFADRIELNQRIDDALGPQAATPHRRAAHKHHQQHKQHAKRAKR